MDENGIFLDLGLMDYAKAWDLQRHLWAKRVKEELPDLVLVLEHPHVITLGRRGNQTHLIASRERLEKMGVALYHVERGGDVTYHGPGQIVVYPILNLKKYGYRVVRHVEQLEEIIIRVLHDFGIEGKREALNRGVWVGRDKIASVGVAVKRWVSFHGIALNYETDLNYFDLINPCGLEGIKMTSMARILGTSISRARVVERVHVHLQQVLSRRWMEKDLSDILPASEVEEERRLPLP